MKKLEKTLRRDGLLYTEIDRNDFVGLYSVGGHYSDKTTHYEVCKIYIRNDEYGEREALPNDELFGRDRSRCFIDEKQALEYFAWLMNHYELLHHATKAVIGIGENPEVIPEYQEMET